MPYLRREGSVFVLDLGEPDQADTDNRFTPVCLDHMHELLDEIESSTGPAALVTTANGKIYSNGFLPELFFTDAVESYMLNAQKMFARILASELPTVAAIPGHVFAGGAIFALTHDVRIMRADRGFFCLPEVDLGVPIPGGMSDLLQARLPAQTFHAAVVTARRFGGGEAVTAGIADQALPLESILPTAIELAESLASKRGPVLAAMKKHAYRNVLDALTTVVFPIPLDKRAQ